MKKPNFLFVLALSVILLGFSGCKKVEQTELNIEDSQYSATIQGTLLYPAGMTATDFVGGTPVAGKTVFVDVPYSYYSGDPYVSGSKRFSTTTDSNGKFSIEIPAKVTSTNVTINVESFAGQHYEFYHSVLENGVYVPKFVQKDVIFKYGGISFPVSASKIEYRNLNLTYNLAGAEPIFNYTAKYTFNVEKISYIQPEGPPYDDPAEEWIALGNKDVIVEVGRYGDGNEYFYIGKTNSNGSVTVDIPVKELTEQVSLFVSANPYTGTLIYYNISDDYQTCTPETKTGLYKASGFSDYYVNLNALQPVKSDQKLRFSFTEN